MDNIKQVLEVSFHFSTDKPSTYLEDLEPLKTIVGLARIVGMGEATHGSKEFTLIRHRMLKFLVEKMGFNGLILETPQQNAKAIDSYIKTGKGDPKELLSELGYWVHNTQEMLNVIEWMRRHNVQNPSKPIAFIGCDIPIADERRYGGYSVRDEAMADICIDTLNGLGADAKVALWSHNMHISYISDGITTQGQFLKNKLGDDYVAFVSLFNEGHFNAIGWDEELEKATGFETFYAPKAPKNTYESILASTGSSLAIFDLRGEEPELTGKKVRDVGSVFDPKHPERLEHNAALSKECDAVIWIDHITASTLLSTNT